MQWIRVGSATSWRRRRPWRLSCGTFIVWPTDSNRGPKNSRTLSMPCRSLPMDLVTTRHSYPRMFELVRLVKRFVEATAAMPKDDTRAMWEQRGQWLQEE